MIYFRSHREMYLQDKIVLVAGSESTAMTSVVKMLLHEKATIVIVAKSAADLNFVKEIAPAEDAAKIVTILVDYPDYYKAAEIVDLITETFGRIDICVFYFKSPGIEEQLLETAITDWEKMVELNISAYYASVRSVFQTMKVNRQGMFVSIHEHFTGNSSSKLIDLSECIHKEMAAIFFEELKNYGVKFYHLLVTDAAAAENAGPFILRLFSNEKADKSELFMPIQGIDK